MVSGDGIMALGLEGGRGLGFFQAPTPTPEAGPPTTPTPQLQVATSRGMRARGRWN